MNLTCAAAESIATRSRLRIANDHVSGCLACQARAVRRRRIARTMAAMRELTRPAPPGMMDCVRPRARAAVPAESPGDPRRRFPEMAAAGATLAGAIAGGIAVIAWRRAQA